VSKKYETREPFLVDIDTLEDVVFSLRAMTMRRIIVRDLAR